MHLLTAIILILPEKHNSKFNIHPVDKRDMNQKKMKFKVAERCLYLKVCYLADEFKCFGYKTDCALYQKSNNETCSEEQFNNAMDKLINKAVLKYQDISK